MSPLLTFNVSNSLSDLQLTSEDHFVILVLILNPSNRHLHSLSFFIYENLDYLFPSFSSNIPSPQYTKILTTLTYQ